MARRALNALAVLALSVGSFGAVQAQPANTVKLIVPFAVGGPTDIAARIVAPLLGEVMGKTIIVENKV
jgi:tripartite-type tricarboxylate transporter receptor subunit TctC